MREKKVGFVRYSEDALMPKAWAIASWTFCRTSLWEDVVSGVSGLGGEDSPQSHRAHPELDWRKAGDRHAHDAPHTCHRASCATPGP